MYDVVIIIAVVNVHYENHLYAGHHLYYAMLCYAMLVIIIFIAVVILIIGWLDGFDEGIF